MGLDMYLNKMPRYRNATAKDVSAVEHYLDWQKAKAEGSEYANCTFKKWCGLETMPKKIYRDFYSQFYKTTYALWDTEKQYGYTRIMEQVGYWRKANHIHNWFVENVQDGEDDCNYHNEVTEEILRELLSACETVLASCEFEGEYVKDPSIAMELLPTSSGFFFGSTEYDEYYVNDIEETIDIITSVLQTTDFDKEMIYYVSSW